MAQDKPYEISAWCVCDLDHIYSAHENKALCWGDALNFCDPKEIALVWSREDRPTLMRCSRALCDLVLSGERNIKFQIFSAGINAFADTKPSSLRINHG